MKKRAVRTFFQAAIGYAAANILAATSGISDMDALTTAIIGLVVSACAAGIAAVMNRKESEWARKE